MKITKKFNLRCLKIANSVLGAYPTILDSPKEMIIESNILMSEELNNPPVNDSIQTITLKFSDELDIKTIDDTIKLYRIDREGNSIELPCVVKIDLYDPCAIRINNTTITRFKQGQEYKISVSKDLKSKIGNTIDDNYCRYFATNYDFNFTNIEELENHRFQILIISDLHLGVDDTFTETKNNRHHLVSFLKQVKKSPNIKELVIGGDLLDEWFLPMDYEMPDSQAEFFDMVANNNKNVINGFNEIIKEGSIKVTYVPGNHDILLKSSDVDRIFPGINQARDQLQGLGSYITGEDSEIVIEHGHKYNIFCAPDPISNREITQNGRSILPPGYFFTRIATTSVIEGHPKTDNVFPEIEPNKKNDSQYNYFLYYQGWKGILSTLPVKEGLAEKVLKTNIDGFTEDYAINECVPYFDKKNGKIDTVLYKGIQDTWDERQTINQVKVKIPVTQAIIGAASPKLTDDQAKVQFFDIDPEKKIVVFGHTHVAHIKAMTDGKGGKRIYANSGTWIDNAQGYPVRTFVVITPNQDDSGIELVNLYQYSKDEAPTQWCEAQAITTL
jgi:UDP-2,3-diacylglucosamine pyrophosphatase LpxH